MVRRVLGEAEGMNIDPRQFILDTPARPEIEIRYEEVFANILGFSSARCQSSDDGRLLKMKILLNRAEQPELGLGEMHYVLRDIPKEFRRRIMRGSVVMRTICGVGALTFNLEPDF